MKRIGITGGIGSGKSFVCRQMEARGVPVYDCDREARRLQEQDADLKAAVIALAGDEAYLPDGRLNRTRLAEWLFSDEEHLKALNAIVHPAVRHDFELWCQRQDAEEVLMESAILEEAGMRDCVDELWEVRAPLETRIRRVMERDGCTREQVLQRISRQKPCSNPDRIIDNP